MQATTIQIAQANDLTFIRELHSAASQCIADGWQVERALDVIELIEGGKYLEAVTLNLQF